MRCSSAIVNDTMARRYWPGQSPLGRRLVVGGTDGLGRSRRHRRRRAPLGPRPAGQPGALSPLAAAAGRGHDLRDRRRTSSPQRSRASVREQLRAARSGSPALQRLKTMDEVAAESVAPRRVAMLLLAILGVLALTLAGIGHLRRDGAPGRVAVGGNRRPDDARRKTARHVMLLVLREGLGPGGCWPRHRAERSRADHARTSRPGSSKSAQPTR